ncbi:PhlD [Streptomyces sp. NPDC020996]|uniref:type III polyketide synthase n=1 Tax=Streptomyces sp. NPDC020996 TaxID=3154791 RepID=UPI0033C2A823
MPVVSAPVVALPRHQVTTDEVLERLAELYPDHPRSADIRRIIGATTVRTRWYTRPLADQLRKEYSLVERTREHLADSLDIAEKAARGSLREAGLEPSDVDALVVASATGHTIPGLDIPLMARLGLRPSVRRVPVTQLGCAGGVFGISTAMDLVAARPGATVLVVCADVFSHYLHRGDQGMDGMIFKGILGDGAGACVVRSRASGPHMELTGSWECVQPGSHHLVGSDTHGDGLHAHNSPGLLNAIRGLLPRLGDWLARTAPEGPDNAPEFIVSHTGSPKILDCLEEGFGCPPEMFDRARDSLREVGNLGSASVLEVLERTFAKPPAEGARGVVLGVGPGIFMTAVRATWRQGV